MLYFRDSVNMTLLLALKYLKEAIHFFRKMQLLVRGSKELYTSRMILLVYVSQLFLPAFRTPLDANANSLLKW